jgi:hypothetical protein
MNFFKHLPKLIILLILTWIGWQAYAYFLDTTVPSVTIHGVNENCYHCNELKCCVVSNKTGDVELWLDGQPLAHSVRIKAQQEGQPFAIPTKTLSNGKHQLTVEFADATFNRNKVNINREFYVDNMPLQAVFVKTGVPYKVFQGRTLHIQFQTNKEIKQAYINALSRSFECFPEAKGSKIYECFIPIEHVAS